MCHPSDSPFQSTLVQKLSKFITKIPPYDFWTFYWALSKFFRYPFLFLASHRKKKEKLLIFLSLILFPTKKRGKSIKFSSKLSMLTCSNKRNFTDWIFITLFSMPAVLSDYWHSFFFFAQTIFFRQLFHNNPLCTHEKFTQFSFKRIKTFFSVCSSAFLLIFHWCRSNKQIFDVKCNFFSFHSRLFKIH